MATTEFAMVRVPKALFDRAAEAADTLGDMSASWLIGRCITEMLDLADTSPAERRMPKVIRTLDAARALGQLLSEGEAQQPAASQRPSTPKQKLVVKGARG